METAIKNALKVDFMYRDASNYKTCFEQIIDLDKHPAAAELKEGEDIEMGQYGTLKQEDFFNSTTHPYPYNNEYDHNILKVCGVEEIVNN